MAFDKVTFRCSQQTLTVLDRLVDERSRVGGTIQGRASTRSGLLRHLIEWLGGITIYADDKQARLDLAKNYQVLLNLGNNLNQLAKAYNQGLITRPVDTANYFEELSESINSLIDAQRSYLELHKQHKNETLQDFLNSLDAISDGRASQ